MKKCVGQIVHNGPILLILIRLFEGNKYVFGCDGLNSFFKNPTALDRKSGLAKLFRGYRLDTSEFL